ncbi:MAG: antA/AntB antirepressor family protein, partial [Clostridium sp.]|uniref:antA/AntB antirepressor family protein n=1 Tax=Clostridium sp. TaxID=1506 RepID=UPI002903D09B
MNELIKIKTNEDDITLSGRELHEFLEIKTEYAKWISRMIEYGFTENQDFRVIVKNDENPKGGRPGSDHEIKLDMAKDLVTITQIAKDYGLSGQALNDKLHELKIQYKIG